MRTKRIPPMQALLQLRQVPFLGQMRPSSLAALAGTMEDMSVRRYERHKGDAEAPRHLLLPAVDIDGVVAPCVGLDTLLEAHEDDEPPTPPATWSRVMCLPEYAVLSLWRDTPMEATRVLRAVARALDDDDLPLAHATPLTEPTDGLVARVAHLARHPAFDFVNRATLLTWVRDCTWVEADDGERVCPGDVLGRVVSVVSGRVQVGSEWYGPGTEVGLARALSDREVGDDVMAEGDTVVLTYDLSALLQLAHSDAGLMRALIAWMARARTENATPAA